MFPQTESNPVGLYATATIPELQQSKTAVLNTLASKHSRRSYEYAIERFIAWYCSEPRLTFNRSVVVRYRSFLERLSLSAATINLHLSAIRRLADESAESGWLSPELGIGIRRVKGVKQSRRKQMVEEYFETTSDEPEWNPRYNIAPTQPVPVIRQNPKEPRRELSLMRRGPIPSWAKDKSGAAMMINARSETAATKPAFRDPLTNRRCLIPADGFYEWQRTGKAKQPYCFEVNDGVLFAFAELWDRWKDPSGQWIKSCSIRAIRSLQSLLRAREGPTIWRQRPFST